MPRLSRPLVLAMIVVGSVAAGGGGGARVAASRPVLPDPSERATFIREEMERRVRLFESLERAAVPSIRSALQDRYDVQYYRLQLDFRDLPAQNLYGRVSARLLAQAAVLDTILFDFTDVLEVDSVLVNGARARFTLDGESLWIRPNEAIPQGSSATTEVIYHGRPPQGGLGAFTFGQRQNGKTIVWTLSEPEGAHLWWPCKDRPNDKADSIDVLIRSPESLVFTSNGLLVETTPAANRTKIYHWKHRYPISTYLVSVTGSDYERLEDEYVDDEGHRMLIEHYVYPEHANLAETDLSITPDAIRVLERSFGGYPFPLEKYGHTIFPWGGAMEHQTNTSYGSGLIRGGHQYDYILVHELGHQWWGDMTSPATWKDIWLNEGFASYSEALWAEADGGFDDYREYMVRSQRVEDPSGPLYDPLVLFDGNTVYNKGSWALHMLRGAIGDSLFFATLHEYRQRTEYRSTTTAEFQDVVEDITRRDMDWFFDSWIYGVDRPVYEVSFVAAGTAEFPLVAIHLDQVQTQTGFFRMPVDLRVDLVGGGNVTKRIWHDPNHLDVEFDVPSQPERVVVDPGDWILKDVLTAPYTFHITTTDFPAVEAGEAISVAVRARGGDLPYTFRAVGPLPAGLILDQATGLVTGAIADSGLYSFTIGVRDRRNQNDLQDFRLRVGETAVDPGDGDGFGPLDVVIGPQPSPWTTFAIRAPEGFQGDLVLYDVGGRPVRHLWEGVPPGRAITWDGRNDGGEEMPSGVYFALLEGDGARITRRFVLLR